MPSVKTLRHILRIIAIGSIGVVAFQLVLAARNLESPSDEAVRLAGLGLPVLFLAFLNLIVWTQVNPRRGTRMYTHFANVLLLVASVLVMRAVPATFAAIVVGCTAALTAISFLFEVHARKIPAPAK